jgi:hypothetical protein
MALRKYDRRSPPGPTEVHPIWLPGVVDVRTRYTRISISFVVLGRVRSTVQEGWRTSDGAASGSCRARPVTKRQLNCCEHRFRGTAGCSSAPRWMSGRASATSRWTHWSTGQAAGAVARREVGRHSAHDGGRENSASGTAPRRRRACMLGCRWHAGDGAGRQIGGSGYTARSRRLMSMLVSRSVLSAS